MWPGACARNGAGRAKSNTHGPRPVADNLFTVPAGTWHGAPHMHGNTRFGLHVLISGTRSLGLHSRRSVAAQLPLSCRYSCRTVAAEKTRIFGNKVGRQHPIPF